MSKNKLMMRADQSAGEYDSVVAAIKDVADTEFVRSSEIFSDDFQNVLNRLGDDQFRLAVVGEFSSGKSTFLNALMGRDILKHGAKETTATITEIQNDPSAGDGILFDVYYMDGSKECDIPVDQLAEYTSTSSQKHNVAHEISRVVIRSYVVDADCSVSFIDTPGLNGLADLHREKTIEQIQNSHACIYLMQVRGLGNSDISFLKYITRYQHNIIFVQNFIDELKKLEGETPEEKVEKQRSIIEENLVDEENPLSYQIVPISARKALIAKDKSISDYDGETLNDQLRETLYQESRFDGVIQAVVGLMKENEKRNLQKTDAIVVALRLMKQLHDVISMRDEREQAEWDNSAEGQQKRLYEQMIEALQKSKEDSWRHIDDYIKSESDEIRRNLNKRMERDFGAMEECVNQCLQALKTEKEINDYLDNECLPNDLKGWIEDCGKACNDEMALSFNYLITAALIRIEEYMGQKADVDTLPDMSINASDIGGEMSSFEHEEDVITKLKAEMASMKGDLVRLQNQERRTERIIRENAEKEQELDKQRQTSTRREQEELNRMGRKPEAETKYRTEIDYVKRGGIGFCDWLFGPKKVERRVKYQDTSRQEQWIRSRNQIEQKYKSERIALDEKIRDNKNLLDEYKAELRLAQKKQKDTARDIEQQEKLMESAVRNLEVKRSQALQEYLKGLRNGIMKEVKTYLEDAQASLKDNFRRTVELNEEKCTKRIQELFDRSFNDRIEELRALMNHHKKDEAYKATKELKATLEQSMKVLEEKIYVTGENG